MADPVVSVLMPVFNGARFLDEAIESILSQSFGDFEFIIVDDGSTDESLVILRRYAEQDSRIRIVSRANTGIVGALNDGLRLARGKYVARMDADDVSLRERFRRQVELLDKRPEVVCVGCAAELIDPSGRVITRSGPSDRSALLGNERVSEYVDVGVFLLHPTLMFRRDALVRCGYRKEYEWLEDADLYVRLSEIGELACLPETLFRYRLHLKSVSRRRQKTQAKLKIKLAIEVAKRRGADPELVREFEELLSAVESEGTDVSGHGMLTEQDELEIMRYWSFLAAKSGYRSTALLYAFKCALRKPFHKGVWWTMSNAVMGHSRTTQLFGLVKRRRSGAATVSVPAKDQNNT